MFHSCFSKLVLNLKLLSFFFLNYLISTLQYGTRLLTSKLNSADTDNLEIVYENPKQLELVTSEVSLAVKSEKLRILLVLLTHKLTFDLDK